MNTLPTSSAESTPAKRTWHAPKLIKHGKVEDLTQGSGGGGLPDEFESISL